MEYADILERHKVLYGDSPVDGITVDLNDLRLQLENEAMGKLIRLRQGVLASGNEADRQLQLLAASLSAIMIIFRAFVRLHRGTPPADNVALVEAVARQVQLDGSPFVRVIRHVRGENTLKATEAPATLGAYLRGMEQLVAYLDRYDTRG
jgi:hypothetical protein